jgi:hypothetical protein
MGKPRLSQRTTSQLLNSANSAFASLGRQARRMSTQDEPLGLILRLGSIAHVLTSRQREVDQTPLRDDFRAEPEPRDELPPSHLSCLRAGQQPTATTGYLRTGRV